MRIISGVYKGRKLKSSSDLSIRPTTDRVKEYIFNILQDFPDGKQTADFFAGSGSLGCEALSRGAKHVIFIEKSETSIQVLRANLDALKIHPQQYRIIRDDALAFVRKNNTQLDLCLIDPPFIYPDLQKLINDLFHSACISDSGIVVVEHEIINPIADDQNFYHIIKQKKIGRSLISFIVKNG